MFVSKIATHFQYKRKIQTEMGNSFGQVYYMEYFKQL